MLLLYCLLLLADELKLLVHDFVKFARPEEILQHGWRELAEENPHEAEEALADCSHLITQEPIIKLELLVWCEEANLGDNQKFKYECFFYFSDQLRLVFEHSLGYLTEKLSLLA